MRNPPVRLDLLIYLRAVPLLVPHISIMVVPLLAAVLDVLFQEFGRVATDPMGGAGTSIFSMIVQLVYLWAFGIAIIQANNVLRARRGSFDEAWEEGRAKFGGILIAAVGFQFVVWAASLIGSFFGQFGLILGAVAAFFLIYTIPAAAIGGLPGQFAISGSIRAVRANVLGSIVLAIVFFALWYFVVPVLLPYGLAGLNVPPLVFELVMALARAIVLAYLAFPFAKQYEDVAFRGFW